MKTTNHSKTLEFEGSPRMQIELSTVGGGFVGRIQVGTDGWDDVNLHAETIERIAAALRLERFERCDYRSVCPDHGYHDADPASCPDCDDGGSLDIRPRCRSCGNRWLPAEGVDAQVADCLACVARREA